MSSRKVLAAGWFGAGNLGDELLLAQFAEWCRGFGADVTAISIDPAFTSSTLGVDAVDFFDLASIAHCLRSSDALVFAGGGLFQTHQPFTVPALFGDAAHDIACYARLALMARQLGVPVFFWAQGIGPLDTPDSRAIIRAMFDDACLASVRDENSRELLRAAGVMRDDIVVAPDPVWAMQMPAPGARPQPAGGSARRLGIAVRPWDGDAAWVDELVEALKWVLAEGDVSLVWMPCQARSVPGRSTSDVEFIRDIAARLPEGARQSIVEVHTPGEWLSALHDCEALVAMRLHAQVLSIRSGIPTFCVEYDPKMSAASQQAGVPANCRVAIDANHRGWSQKLRDWWRSPGAVDLAVAQRLSDEALVHKTHLGRALSTLGPREDRAWHASPYDWLGGIERISHDRALARRDAQIAHRDQLLAQANAGLLAYGQDLDSKAQQLADARAALARLRQQADELQRNVSAAEASIAELSGQLADANRVGNDRGRQIDELRGRVSSLRDEVNLLRTSTSWRITRPLRFLKYFIVSPRHALSLARRAMSAPARPLPPVVAGPVPAPAPERVDMTWDEFERTVLSARDTYEGVFVQDVVIDWNVPLYQRPQHMACALGRLGYLVVYKTTNWTHDDVQGVRRVAENVWLTNCPEVDHMVGVVRSVYSTAYAGDLGKLTSRGEGNVMVYEYIDHIDPKISGDQENIRRLLQIKDWAFSGGADIIVASARQLATEARAAVGEARVIVAPNGVDTAHYRDPRHGDLPLPQALLEFRASHRVIVGYFGAIAPWLWYEVIGELVQSRPDIGFVFIGPDYYGGVDRLPRAKNVLYLGPVDYKDLPAYAATFDVCFIPFEPGEIARTTSPLKLFEYFALERPVVVTSDMEECVAYPEVFSGDSVSGLADAIDRAVAVKDDPATRARHRELADENDWTHRAMAYAHAFTLLRRRAGDGRESGQ